MQRYGAAWLSLGLILGAAGAASAATCTNIYDTSNGTTTLPGTFVGTVGGASGVCQIGNLSASGQGNAMVSGSADPSNYEFYFGGGSLTIEEELGNNGIGNAINVELESWNGATATPVPGASIQIPFTSGPSGEYTLISNKSLSASDYVLSNSLAIEEEVDPRYQANFTATSSVPEPSPLSVLIVSLAALAALVRYRQA